MSCPEGKYFEESLEILANLTTIQNQIDTTVKCVTDTANSAEAWQWHGDTTLAQTGPKECVGQYSYNLTWHSLTPSISQVTVWTLSILT